MHKLFLILFLFCKGPNIEFELAQLSKNKKLSAEELSYSLASKLLGNTLKNFQIEKNKDAYDIYINYGNDRAYTFQSQNQYAERMQFDIVKLIINLFVFLKDTPISSLRISYSKPFFVKTNDREHTEEFEIFRVKVFFSDLKNISGLKFIHDKKKMDSDIRENFNKVRLVWKIEMNETARIELK